MRITLFVLMTFLGFSSLPTPADAAVKPHVVGFGKWTTVKWFSDSLDGLPIDLKVRALLVDGRAKETTLGVAHEVTDRLFVVRRAFRLNDALPEEAPAASHWRWERGGWLLVDRVTGRVSPIVLPEFDSYYSVASWYRDYVAYCGVSDDGSKVYAVVAQLGRRKPLLKKTLDKAGIQDGNVSDLPCTAPIWQRQPVRVSIGMGASQKPTYSIRGHAVDMVADDEPEEDSPK